MVTTTELATIKSKHQRDVAELRDKLHRANIASDRDQALREKVFNEAKAEVMSLNKKVSNETLWVYPTIFDVVAISVVGKRIAKELFGQTNEQIWQIRRGLYFDPS